MTNLTHRDPNPNNYVISKVIDRKKTLAAQKEQLKDDKAVAKKKRINRERQRVKDRISIILERHKTSQLEAHY